MTTLELPETAAAKLRRLELLSDEAQAAAHFCTGRISDIDRALGLNPNSPNKEAALLEQQELVKARAGHQDRHRTTAGLLAGVRQWSAALRARHGISLEAVTASDGALPGETIHQAVARIRTEIVALKRHQRTIALAPPPKADLDPAAYVANLARQFQVGVGIQDAQLKVNFSLPDAIGGLRPDHLLAALAWLDKDALAARLQAEIDRMPEPELALPTAEKKERLTDLTAKLDELERQEEALVSKAEAEGLHILRRHDASPAALLGVRVVTEAMRSDVAARATRAGRKAKSAAPASV